MKRSIAYGTVAALALLILGVVGYAQITAVYDPIQKKNVPIDRVTIDEIKAWINSPSFSRWTNMDALREYLAEQGIDMDALKEDSADLSNRELLNLQGRRGVIKTMGVGRFNSDRGTALRDIDCDIDDKEIPERARRTHPTWGDKQFLSTYILHDVLKKRLPDDGCVILGLTATDLWPGKGWNFVFGQASIRERVGVWSIYRNGTADGTKDEFRLCLKRTLKIAVHETGHMFTMRHCTAYECCMCGSNSLPESDARPIVFCPECMAKVCWVTKADPLERMTTLAEFCKKHMLASDLKLYEKQIKRLK